MAATPVTPEELAEALLGAAPTLDPDEQRLVVALYRALAEGAPVSPASLAAELGISPEHVEEALGRWPGVYRNEAGEVIGFWGLALSGMPHHLEIGTATIDTWCALDPFLIVPLLGKEARVRSEDPVTGKEVALALGPEGVRKAAPETAVISMLVPEGEFDHDVVASFCHFVWFFASPESGEGWIAEHPGTFLLDIDSAQEAARRSWPALVGKALGPKTGGGQTTPA